MLSRYHCPANKVSHIPTATIEVVTPATIEVMATSTIISAKSFLGKIHLETKTGGYLFRYQKKMEEQKRGFL